jgi:hypothetical protein
MFNGRLTFKGITAPLVKMQEQLSALVAQNNAEVGKNNQVIATLNASNAELKTEAAMAANTSANISSFLKQPLVQVVKSV